MYLKILNKFFCFGSKPTVKSFSFIQFNFFRTTKEDTTKSFVYFLGVKHLEVGPRSIANQTWSYPELNGLIFFGVATECRSWPNGRWPPYTSVMVIPFNIFV